MMTTEENIRAILECNYAGLKDEIIDTAVKEICELKQESKTGHWNTYKLSRGGIDEEWLECSECMWSNALVIPRKYCPNCGAKMESEE